MTAPVRFCLCAHPRGRHQANPFTGQRSGPCKPSCGCGSYRPATAALTEPVRVFVPGEESTEEAG